MTESTQAITDLDAFKLESLINHILHLHQWGLLNYYTERGWITLLYFLLFNRFPPHPPEA